MEPQAGAQISTRSFIQSLLILFILMVAAGALTRIVPAGSFARLEMDGREVIQPGSFEYTPRPDYPIWRWFTAPLEVLGGVDSLTIITIIVFLLMVGVSFAILDGSGLLQAALARIVRAYGDRKYILLLAISLFFMLIGAFFGIFEEVAPLVPLMIALSYSLGWDSLVGLGMGILATNMGFSAAITNPFTIGVAQKIAGLPLFSGAWFRIPVFIVIYLIFAAFLVRYARKIERNPQASPVFEADRLNRQRYSEARIAVLKGTNQTAGPAAGLAVGRALTWLLIFIVLILATLFSAPFVPAISQLSLPIVGLLFLMAGVGAGFIAGCPANEIRRSAWQGLSGIAPAIPLILMAASIKHIVAQGGIMDTILNSAANSFANASPFLAAQIVYGLALVIEFFIGSGSAKAFLMMPILLPLADLVGVTRQVAVTAYCFGDGFSNLAYPTNPVLLVCLGLTVVSYPKWIKWTLRLWFWVILATIIFLALGVAIRLGPF